MKKYSTFIFFHIRTISVHYFVAGGNWPVLSETNNTNDDVDVQLCTRGDFLMKKNDIAEKLCRRGTKCQYNSWSDRIMISYFFFFSDRSIANIVSPFHFLILGALLTATADRMQLYHRDHIYWTTSPLFKCHFVTFSETCNNYSQHSPQDRSRLGHTDPWGQCLESRWPRPCTRTGWWLFQRRWPRLWLPAGAQRPSWTLSLSSTFYVLLFVCCTTS